MYGKMLNTCGKIMDFKLNESVGTMHLALSTFIPVSVRSWISGCISVPCDVITPTGLARCVIILDKWMRVPDGISKRH